MSRYIRSQGDEYGRDTEGDGVEPGAQQRERHGARRAAGGEGDVPRRDMKTFPYYGPDLRAVFFKTRKLTQGDGGAEGVFNLGAVISNATALPPNDYFVGIGDEGDGLTAGPLLVGRHVELENGGAKGRGTGIRTVMHGTRFAVESAVDGSDLRSANKVRVVEQKRPSHGMEGNFAFEEVDQPHLLPEKTSRVAIHFSSQANAESFIEEYCEFARNYGLFLQVDGADITILGEAPLLYWGYVFFGRTLERYNDIRGIFDHTTYETLAVGKKAPGSDADMVELSAALPLSHVYPDVFDAMQRELPYWRVGKIADEKMIFSLDFDALTGVETVLTGEALIAFLDGKGLLPRDTDKRNRKIGYFRTAEAVIDPAPYLLKVRKFQFKPGADWPKLEPCGDDEVQGVTAKDVGGEGYFLIDLSRAECELAELGPELLRFGITASATADGQRAVLRAFVSSTLVNFVKLRFGKLARENSLRGFFLKAVADAEVDA